MKIKSKLITLIIISLLVINGCYKENTEKEAVQSQPAQAVIEKPTQIKNQLLVENNALNQIPKQEPVKIEPRTLYMKIGDTVNPNVMGGKKVVLADISPTGNIIVQVDSVRKVISYSDTELVNGLLITNVNGDYDFNDKKDRIVEVRIKSP